MNDRPASDRFYGWTVVTAAFVVAIFGWGVGFYGPPIFLKAVQDAHGWPVALISAAVTLHFLVGAIVVANLPRLHRRFGLPLTTFAGAALLAMGVFGWSIAREPWQLFVATLFSGAGWVALGAAAINAMVSPWFITKRPAALATAYNGASVGGVLFSPLWVALIGNLGFPLASAIVGAAMLIVIAALAGCILSRTPASMGVAPDGQIQTTAHSKIARPVSDHAPDRLFRDAAFITLSLGMALGLFAQIGLIAHMFSLLAPAMGASMAGMVAGLATAAAIGGRTVVGWLMPAGADRRVIAALNYGVQILGCAAFIAADGANIPLLVAGAILFGFGIGNATSLPPLIAQAEFAPSLTPRVVALATAISQGAYAFAPAAFGLLRDATTGSAPTLFIVAAAIQALAAAAYLIRRAGALRASAAVYR